MSKMLTKKESASVNAIHMFTCLTSPVALLDIEVYEADGQQSTSLVQKAAVPITVGGRTFQIDLIFLPHAKGNRTLLGVHFLRTSGIVMDMRNNFWYFGDKPSFRIPFSKDVPLPVDDSPVEINSSSCPTNSIPSEIPLHSNTVDEAETNDLHLKEHLKKEIDNLLADNIIEECESPYAAPVVLVPKSNGTVRLCIDYRKLYAITIPDKYPLPLMDVLLHDAKSTAFMSTLDLKSGYHQVEVNPADQDKTAFVCSFGTFRYKRMPFGLRNAPATFQRLMDQFRNGLANVNILVYLDDIVVLSETFEQHIEDLRMVFDRLKKFKLCANRKKCKFVCSRVKYLGLWITPKGIEVDQDKTAAIQNIPSPRNLKQLQSFLQTCSWYRKFIPNFSDIARPFSNWSKKSTAWKWTEIEQQAFQTLKQCLITPPILRRVDPKKPFIIRTDASSYALGAVLLQGESPTNEQPVEYASRLLSSSEKNYSTTEREALAVVWAFNKFREYIEGAEITVASDHQPLKWLMNLTSPTGRLARAPEYRDEEICELKTIIIDFPTRTANELRTEQLKDLELKKIVDCFENPNKRVDFANWTGRGYVMNQGVLYRISLKYYWTGMRKFIAGHVKSCSECIRYKATNQKPEGLLQTPVPAQRFESIAIDLFGPLPETTEVVPSPCELKIRDEVPIVAEAGAQLAHVLRRLYQYVLQLITKEPARYLRDLFLQLKGDSPCNDAKNRNVALNELKRTYVPIQRGFSLKGDLLKQEINSCNCLPASWQHTYLVPWKRNLRGFGDKVFIHCHLGTLIIYVFISIKKVSQGLEEMMVRRGSIQSICGNLLGFHPGHQD
ncbi:retrovirus-related Pol polyprotein from transposon 297 [Trichonephila clavipes]|nr:retrovirus-related Pol polyprotein from transposon 297 [Trichonephila clavipes]